ncbi:MAG: hypothetical protein JRN20_13695 [Nitrososphaerota archaeon]|nr:hypothetical protein [Nitrososphaerota archaeon]
MDKATIRNPQQVEMAPHENTRIVPELNQAERIDDPSWGACGIENHCLCGCKDAGNPFPIGNVRSEQRVAVLSITGGCLNPSAVVFLAERERRLNLSPVDKGQRE